MKKLAVIRQDGGLACPFGLDIAIACRNAGESVDRMVPLDTLPKEKREKYAAANRKVYVYEKTDQRCLYADKIPEIHPYGIDTVNCDFDDTGEGERDSPLPSSKYYARIFNGLADSGWPTGGLHSYPLSVYYDNIEMQQLFSGLGTVMVAAKNVNNINKSAITIDPKLQKILEKIFGG